VRAHQAKWPVRTQCRVLEVSTSGFYAWCKHQPSARDLSDDELAGIVLGIHAFSRHTYGRPRIHAELHKQKVHVSRKRVRRVMHEYGLFGVRRRRFVVTTQRDGLGRPAPDLVDRKFRADAPDRLWVADITSISTWEGFLYLAVVLDVFSRRIVGWSMSSSLHTQIVLDALNMAIHLRKPKGVIHHSDQGSQYTSLAFGQRCKDAGVRPSMGSVADCYDNAMCESFFATLECELQNQHNFRTREEARLAVFEFIVGWYNPHRLHSALGYRSPIEFEQDYETRQEPAA
jgi:putative transposase